MKIHRRAMLASGAAVATLPLLSKKAAAQNVPGGKLPEGSVVLVAQVTAKPGKEAELKKATMAMLEPTRKEKGCLCYNLHQNQKDKTAFMFYEQWASQEALDVHGKTAHMQAFRQAMREGELVAEGGVTFYQLL